MKAKIAIIGDGNVGSALAYGLVCQDAAREVALIDIDRKRVQGDVLDLLHGQLYAGRCAAKVGSYGDLSDASIVVLTASVSG